MGRTADRFRDAALQMTTRLGTVAENNNNAETVLTGTLATGALAGLTVLGVHFAGQRSGNVGTAFEGIYGSLTVNANGTFTYRLDNTDTDTDLLATGDSAIERFTVTYRLGGVVHTVAVEVAINGVDEPGQAINVLDDAVEVISETVIGRDERTHFTSPRGYEIGTTTDSDPRWTFTNYGSISLASDDPNSPSGWTTSAVPLNGAMLNYGRITSTNEGPIRTGVYAQGGSGENHGVVSAILNGEYDGSGTLNGAVAWGGSVLNTGLIEAISTLVATGVDASYANNIVNHGFIYVEGGSAYPTDADRPYGQAIYGYRTSGTWAAVNTGTVHVVSNAQQIEAIGFAFGQNATNIYNTVYFDNSGTIVADRAVSMAGNYRSSMNMVNSGHIEGSLFVLDGVSQIFNTAEGFWAGDFELGLDHDTVFNAGEIVGSIYLNIGHDAYYANGEGSVSGTVFGEGGNDLLQGGSATERLSGGEGNDWISGGGSSDELSGGTGADTFHYSSWTDSFADQRDTITDFESGVDRIDISQIGASGFTLTADGNGTILRATTTNGTLEVFVTGTLSPGDIVTAIPSITLTGTLGSDMLVAARNGTSLLGGDGSDALHGSSGNDFLDGGAGADAMAGGGGDDVYVMDVWNDLIIETADGGIDELRTFVSTILPTFVENGRIMGSGLIDLSGNQLDNVLIGNSASNILRGNGGNDVMIGRGGRDVLYMNHGDVRSVYESANDSLRGAADIYWYFDPAGDVIDLSALDVEHFTIGEYVRRAETGGAGVFFYDMTVVSVMTSQGELVIELPTAPTLDSFDFLRVGDAPALLYGLDLGDVLLGGIGGDRIEGRGGDDRIEGHGGVDLLIGGLGDDTIDGGSNVDTAVVAGLMAGYAITQTSTGVFQVVGEDGTDVLTNVEYLQFDDQTIRLLPGIGVSVDFETSDPNVYQSALESLRDFDGNDLGGDGAWLRIGSADVNGDGDIDQILVNDAIGRFATVGVADDGLVYFEDHGWAGETRVAGIYIDPLVQSGDVVAGSDQDSQRRFQNDLEIENINRVLGAEDYDGDGVWEVYFALTDGSAYLRALMHEDGNIRYANYQSEQEVIDYLTANGSATGLPAAPPARATK